MDLETLYQYGKRNHYVKKESVSLYSEACNVPGMHTNFVVCGCRMISD